MTPRLAARPESKNHHSIHIGGVYASKDPAVVHTVLGSCIAVCLFDKDNVIGGMNHFMLPEGSLDAPGSTRYGVHAMELLINQCMKLGADRYRLSAKVFGGGHVLKMRETESNVPRSNIRFALDFLQNEKIPILSQDLGGYAARVIYFHTDTGRTLLKRLEKTGANGDNEMVELEREERQQLKNIAKISTVPDDNNITLF